MLVPTDLRRVVRTAIAAVLLLTLAGPVLEIRAATDLYPGAPAVVNSLSAPYASIKTAPDPAAVELVQIDNGIGAEIIAGPVPGVDGLLWYQISVSGISGYIAETDLAWGAAPQSDPAPVQELAPPVVTGTGVVISSDGSDIGCRTAPANDANWLFAYASGSSVDLAGQPTDGWQPVICANQLGYLPAQLVYDPANLPAAEPTEIATEIPTEIVETPEITEVATDVIPEVTDTVEVPVETEAVVIPEETSTPEMTEIVVEETATPEVIETVVGETTTPDLTETATESAPAATETVGSTEPSPTETATAALTETEIVEIIDVPESVGQTVAGGDVLVSATSLAGAAVVFNTGPGGLRCRSGASLESSVLLVLSPGTQVSLTGAASKGWQPVVCNGQSGFVAARFLQSADETVQDQQDASVSPAAALTGSTGVVQNTDGMGLRCRSAASLTASVITVLSEGTVIVSRGSAVGVWQPVTCAGVAGWVHTDYIGNSSGGSTSGNTGGSTGSTSGAASVSGTNGDGVRFRSGASYDASVIAVLMEGTSVSLRSGSVGSWTAVTYGGTNGFVFADFLSTARNPSTPGSGSGVGSTGLATGSNAQVTDTLNFRSAASYSAGVVGVAPVGTVVRVTGSPSGGFYPVQWGGVSGYMHGDYLVYTTSALSTSGPNSGVGGGGVGAGAGSGSGSSTGQAMVNYAMRYLGYPYVWATHGPSSFDCSGFTYWVVLNVTGRDIGAGTWTQWGTGSPIQYGNLQPGDLVFFQNTYTVGLSHVGMYIGNDQFIHAENENTGVRISSLTSTYYSTRYLGARRMG